MPARLPWTSGKFTVLHIGDYVIDTPVFVAPMAGITDSVYRTLCIAMGAGWAVSEMVSL